MNKSLSFQLFVDEVIERWQKTLDDMKADGTYDKIAFEYGLITER